MAEAPATLKVLLQLHQRFLQDAVPYALWKSLESAVPAITKGEGDIDILFLEKDKPRILSILRSFGAVLDWDSPATLAPHLLEFRLFDQESTIYIAFHAHFQCLFGSKKWKELRYAHEESMLSTAELRHGLMFIHDRHFIPARLLHASVKQNTDDHHCLELAQRMSLLPLDLQEEIGLRLASYCGQDQTSTIIKDLLAGSMDSLMHARPAILTAIEKDHPSQAIITAIKAQPRRTPWLHRAARQYLRVKRNKLNRGLCITLAGHDGAGKTTISTIIPQIMHSMAPVRRIYLGRKWSWLNQRLNTWRERSWGRWLNFFWPASSSCEIALRMLRGKILAKLGFIIIFDRSLLDLKWKNEDKPWAQRLVPLLLYRWLYPHESSLKFLLVASSSAVISRKGAQHTAAEIDGKREFYIANSPGFTIMNTDDISAPQSASAIIHALMQHLANHD